MTTLLTRMRPLTSHTPRIRLPHRTPRARFQLKTVLPAAEERLATRSEIELLRTMLATSSVGAR